MLLQELKDYLKITWDDEDRQLEKMLSRGKNYLNDLTGTDLDYTEDYRPKTLLLDYCRYVHNNASEYFEDNYQKEIVRLQLSEAVKDSAIRQEE